MSDIPESFLHYLEAWNESDKRRIRAHLEKSVSPGVLFVDPAHTTQGIDALESMIVSAREERPGASYHRTSGVDGHNRRYRYLWEVRVNGKPLLPGMDVTTIAEDGAIVQIDGFFGDFPPWEG